MGFDAVKKSVNPISLVQSQNIYTGNPASNPKRVWFIIDPSGDSDELQYSSWYEAIYALMECQGIGNKIIRALNGDGLYFAQGIDPDNESAIDDWLHANAERVLNENGYRIIGKFEGSKS